MVQYLLSFPGHGNRFICPSSLSVDPCATDGTLHPLIKSLLSLPPELDITVKCNAKLLPNTLAASWLLSSSEEDQNEDADFNNNINNNSGSGSSVNNINEAPIVLHVGLPLVGGKGGFGALLKAQSKKSGAKQTTDFGACRDLNGRRLRHVNDEVKLARWREREEKRKNGEKEKQETTKSGIEVRIVLMTVAERLRERWWGRRNYLWKGLKWQAPGIMSVYRAFVYIDRVPVSFGIIAQTIWVLINQQTNTLAHTHTHTRATQRNATQRNTLATFPI